MRWPLRRAEREPPTFSLDFARLDQAAQVRLVTNVSKRLAATDDPTTIATLVELIHRHGDQWEVPDGGVPVTSLRLDFCDVEGQPLGNVGIGRTVVTTHQHGGFFSRPSDGELRRRALELLAVADPDD